jgi:hypothetical protein
VYDCSWPVYENSTFGAIAGAELGAASAIAATDTEIALLIAKSPFM